MLNTAEMLIWYLFAWQLPKYARPKTKLFVRVYFTIVLLACLFMLNGVKS